MGCNVVGLLLFVTFVVAVNCRAMEPAAEFNGEGIFKSLEAVEEMKLRSKRSPHDADEIFDNIKTSLSDGAQTVRKGFSTVIQDIRKSETYGNVRTGINNLGEQIQDQFKKVGSQIQQKLEDKFD